jgi:hypothetical protein
MPRKPQSSTVSGLLVRYVDGVATGAAPATLTPATSVPGLRDAVVEQWVTAAWETAQRCDLETELYFGIKSGLPRLIARAIEESDDYPQADRALRRVFFEMPERPASEVMLQVWAYGKRVTSPDYRKQARRGRPRHRDLALDFSLCLVVCLAWRELGMHPTRSQKHSQCYRSDRPPSAISAILAALERTHRRLHEPSFQVNAWEGLPGELARRIFGIS